MDNAEKTSKPYQLNLGRVAIVENKINAVIINKIDSSYLKLGEAELKVLASDFEKAQEILNDVEK